MSHAASRSILHTLPLRGSVPLPLLVTGVSGVAGLNAFFYLRGRYPGRVIGIRPTRTVQLTGRDIVPLDTEDVAGLAALFREHRFRGVLNTTGNCALKSCELAPDMAYRTNVTSAVHLAQLAADHGARLVHLSSDLVYSGTGQGGYVETDSVDPVTVYGRTMAEGEAAVAALHPAAAVLRISLPMGPSYNHHAGAIDWIESRFRKGRPATLYFDEVRSATYCDDLNRVFEYFLTSDDAGLYHLGGPRAVTLNQIGQIVNRVGGYEPGLLRGCLRHEAGPIPPRAGDVSMDSGKLIRLLGGNPFHPWPSAGELVPTGRDWHYHRPAGEVGSHHAVAHRLYRVPGGATVIDAVLHSLRGHLVH
ncbi:MAG: sugar nucleotide-binding protein [Gemmataceae bacterium]